MNRRWEDSPTVKIIKLSWPYLVAIASVCMTFAVMSYKVEAHQKSLDKNEEAHNIFNTRIGRVEEGVAQLPEIRSDIKSILREMRRNDRPYRSSSRED